MSEHAQLGRTGGPEPAEPDDEDVTLSKFASGHAVAVSSGVLERSVGERPGPGMPVGAWGVPSSDPYGVRLAVPE